MNLIILEFVRGYGELPKPFVRILQTTQRYGKKLYYLEDEQNKEHLDLMKSLSFLEDISRDFHKLPDGWSGSAWDLLPILYDEYVRTQSSRSNGFILYADQSLARSNNKFNSVSDPYTDLANNTQVSTVVCLEPSSIEDEYIIK